MLPGLFHADSENEARLVLSHQVLSLKAMMIVALPRLELKIKSFYFIASKIRNDQREITSYFKKIPILEAITRCICLTLFYQRISFT